MCLIRFGFCIYHDYSICSYRNRSPTVTVVFRCLIEHSRSSLHRPPRAGFWLIRYWMCWLQMILYIWEVPAWVFAQFSHLLEVGTLVLFGLSAVFIMDFDTLTQQFIRVCMILGASQHTRVAISTTYAVVAYTHVYCLYGPRLLYLCAVAKQAELLCYCRAGSIMQAILVG